MRGDGLFLAIVPALHAATLESAPRPPAPPPLTVSCRGITFFGLIRPSDGLPIPSAPVTTEFLGADPACVSRSSSRLPGVRNEYSRTGRQEGLPIYSMRTFQNVWPGIDVTHEVSGLNVRIVFDITNPGQFPAFRMPTGEFLTDSEPTARFPIDDLRFFGPDTRATLRAEEITPYGPIAVAVQPNPLRLPTKTNHPVRITLEASFPRVERAVSASHRDRDGNRYDAIGPVIKKYSPAGILLFETELAGGEFTELVAGPENSIYAIGSTLSPEFPSTIGAPFSGVFVYITPRAKVPYGDATVTRLDATTGRVLFSTILGGPFMDSARLLDVGPDGALRLLVTSNSPQFPRIGPALDTPCQPRAPYISLPVGFTDAGISCSYIVHLAPADGAIVTSTVLPPNSAGAAIAPGGTIFVLRFTNRFYFTAVDSYPDKSRGFALPNIPYIGGVSLAVTSAGAVWLSANERLFFRPPGARNATELPYNGEIFLQPTGEVIVSGGSFYPRPWVVFGEEALMPSPCLQADRFFVIFSASGTVQYASYLPDTVESPSRSAPPALRDRTLIWSRHTLDFDAPAHPAAICSFSTQVKPGASLQIPVRGVPDASPFRPSVRPGDPLPTQVRGLTVRFNGIPAGIIELNKDTLTVAVPPALTAPLDFTVWQGDRQVQFDPYFSWFWATRYEGVSVAVGLAP